MSFSLALDETTTNSADLKPGVVDARCCGTYGSFVSRGSDRCSLRCIRDLAGSESSSSWDEHRFGQHRKNFRCACPIASSPTGCPQDCRQRGVLPVLADRLPRTLRARVGRLAASVADRLSRGSRFYCREHSVQATVCESTPVCPSGFRCSRYVRVIGLGPDQTPRSTLQIPEQRAMFPRDEWYDEGAGGGET